MDELNRKIAVIGDSMLVSGLKLAGIKAAYVLPETGDIDDMVRQIISNNQIGIVVMNTATLERITDKRLTRTIESSTLPIFVTVPSYNQSGFIQEDTLKKLIVRALGIDISG